MYLTYSAHAQEQITHRGISTATIKAVIKHPENETWDGQRSARYLNGFCAVVIPMRDGAHVVTVYDTDAKEPERRHREATGTKKERKKSQWHKRRRPGMAPNGKRWLQLQKHKDMETADTFGNGPP